MNMLKQARIVTVTLNPALDQTMYFSQFHIGQVNRVGKERLDPAGKGVNVAKVIRSLDQEVTVTGFLGCENSRIFEEYFQAHQIHDQFVKVDGANRINTKIVDESNKQVTEINFPGIKYLASDLEKLKRKMEQLAEESQIFVLSGSLPEWAPIKIYREFIEVLKQYQCKVFLDTSGGALEEGIKEKPYAIKPNVFELEQLMGYSMEHESDILGAINTLISEGINKVIVSLGEKGALVADGSKGLIVTPPDVQIGSTVGAGDALVAGLVFGEAKGMPLEEQARWATAVAAASVAKLGTQAGTLRDVEKLLPYVIIKEVKV